MTKILLNTLSTTRPMLFDPRVTEGGTLRNEAWTTFEFHVDEAIVQDQDLKSANDKRKRKKKEQVIHWDVYMALAQLIAATNHPAPYIVCGER